jgi:hypothetical protein
MPAAVDLPHFPCCTSVLTAFPFGVPQGYNRDGLSRQEIISLLRMVLRAEDDRSSSRGGGGRGYDGADAELYGRKVCESLGEIPVCVGPYACALHSAVAALMLPACRIPRNTHITLHAGRVPWL